MAKLTGATGPAPTAVGTAPAGSLTWTGTWRLPVPPYPSRPLSPTPQARTCPGLVSARLCSQPARVAWALGPAGRGTGAGGGAVGGGAVARSPCAVEADAH